MLRHDLVGADQMVKQRPAPGVLHARGPGGLQERDERVTGRIIAVWATAEVLLDGSIRWTA